MVAQVNVFSRFEAARPAWQRIERDGECYPFQTYAWCNNWFELVGAARGLTPCIAFVETQRGDPLMLLPLAIEQRRLHTALVWIGGVLADYHGPLLGPTWTASKAAEKFTDLWKQICDALPSHDIIAFEKQPASIGGHPNPFVALPIQTHPARAHFAVLGDSLDGFLRERRSARSLQSDRRKERRLAEQGRLEFVIAKDPDGIAPLLNAMIEQKTRSYAELGVANVFAEPGTVEFITRMTVEFPETVRLFALTLDDQPLATLWGLVHRDRYYHLFPTYSRNRCSNYSPGNVLLTRVFAWCIDNGIDIYDFTVGDEGYKEHWCEHDLALFDTDEAVTARGKPVALMRRARSTVKRYIKGSPKLFVGAKRMRRMLGGTTAG